MNLQLFEAQNMIEAFREGKQKGFVHFFNWLQPSLVFYAFKIIDDKIAAEDIVEEAFIKIWDRRTAFLEAAKIKSWMYATCRNACFDHFRSRQKQQKDLNDLGIILEGDVERDNLDLMIEAEVFTDVYHHLHSLPPRCEQVMRLLFIEDKSLKDVAIAMKTSINTVKNQRARGLELIRKRMAI